MLLLTLGPSSLPVVVAQPDEKNEVVFARLYNVYFALKQNANILMSS